MVGPDARKRRSDIEGRQAAMRPTRLINALLLGAVLAATLSACGRKSSLDTPYEAQLEARREAERNDQPVPPEPAPPVANQPFILDPLID